MSFRWRSRQLEGNRDRGFRQTCAGPSRPPHRRGRYGQTSRRLLVATGPTGSRRLSGQRLARAESTMLAKCSPLESDACAALTALDFIARASALPRRRTRRKGIGEVSVALAALRAYFERVWLEQVTKLRSYFLLRGTGENMPWPSTKSDYTHFSAKR